MTIDQFKATQAYQLRMRELLQDDTLQLAITTLLDHNRPMAQLYSEPEICSTRKYSEVLGWNKCLAALLRLAEPPHVKEEPTPEPSVYVSMDNPDADIIQPIL